MVRENRREVRRRNQRPESTEEFQARQRLLLRRRQLEERLRVALDRRRRRNVPVAGPRITPAEIQMFRRNQERRNGAIFRFDIRTVAGAPHLISFEATAPGNNDSVSMDRNMRGLARKMKDEITTAAKNFTNWSTSYIRKNVKGLLAVVNADGDGNSTAEDMIRVKDLNTNMLESLLTEIQQSNLAITLYDLKWEFWITPQSLVRGGSQTVKIPKWALGQLIHTWKAHSDIQGSIACAAFSIAWSLGLIANKRDLTTSDFQWPIKKARELMTDLDWEEDVTLIDLPTYVKKYPEMKLVVITPFAIRPLLVVAGTEFDLTKDEQHVHAHTIFLAYCVTQNHYGATRKPGLITGRCQGLKVTLSGSVWKWCHQCDSAYNPTHITQHTCEGSIYRPTNQVRTCPDCNIQCAGTCHNCQGYNCASCALNYPKGTYHRCLFMTRKSLSTHFENETPEIDIEEEEFCKPGNNDKRLIIADLESAMYRVYNEQRQITTFRKNKEMKFEKGILTYPDGEPFLDEDGELDDDIAFYGFQHVEQRANYCYAEDGCDDSVQKMFKGENCLQDFILWVTEYNDGILKLI